MSRWLILLRLMRSKGRFSPELTMLFHYTDVAVTHRKARP